MPKLLLPSIILYIPSCFPVNRELCDLGWPDLPRSYLGDCCSTSLHIGHPRDFTTDKFYRIKKFTDSRLRGTLISPCFYNYDCSIITPFKWSKDQLWNNSFNLSKGYPRKISFVSKFTLPSCFLKSPHKFGRLFHKPKSKRENRLGENGTRNQKSCEVWSPPTHHAP